VIGARLGALAHLLHLALELVDLLLRDEVGGDDRVARTADGADELVELIWVAFISRLVVAWMTNTIRNVTIVVAVLITSCHVSEKPNSGPVISHVTMTTAARSSANGEPAAFVTRAASRRNESRMAPGR
jgi:hypothetical protein